MPEKCAEAKRREAPTADALAFMVKASDSIVTIPQRSPVCANQANLAVEDRLSQIRKCNRCI